MIADEMIGFDIDLPNDAAQSQLNDTPIMSRRAAAAGFPSVHPFAARGVLIGNEDAATWLEKILLRREEFVVREQCDATEPSGGKIDKAGRRGGYRSNGAHAWKFQIPTSRLPRNSKLQDPISGASMVGGWLLELLWNLEFG